MGPNGIVGGNLPVRIKLCSLQVGDVNYDMVTSELLIQLTPGRALHCKLFTQVWFKAKFRRLSSHIRLLCPFLSKSKISTYY